MLIFSFYVSVEFASEIRHILAKYHTFLLSDNNSLTMEFYFQNQQFEYYKILLNNTIVDQSCYKKKIEELENRDLISVIDAYLRNGIIFEFTSY